MQSEEVIKKAGESLIKALDETLLVLGESVRQEIHSLLEKAYSVQLNHFPTDWKAVSESLRRIFAAGAQNFECFILKEMAKRLEIEVEQTLDFVSSLQKMDFQLRKRIGAD